MLLTKVKRIVNTQIILRFDALKPLHRLEDGTLRHHAVNNMVPPELALNYFKHIYPGGILKIVKEWVLPNKPQGARKRLKIQTSSKFTSNCHI